MQTPPLHVNWNAGPGPRTGGPRRTDAGGGAGHAVGETRGGPRRGVFRAPVSQRRSPRSTATRPVRDLKAFPRDGALWVEWTPPGPPVAKYVLEWCVLSDRAPCLPDWQQEEGSVQRTFLTGTPRARARPSHASCARSSPRLLAACARRPVGVTWGRPGDRPDALLSALRVCLGTARPRRRLSGPRGHRAVRRTAPERHGAGRQADPASAARRASAPGRREARSSARRPGLHRAVLGFVPAARALAARSVHSADKRGGGRRCRPSQIESGGVGGCRREGDRLVLRDSGTGRAACTNPHPHVTAGGGFGLLLGLLSPRLRPTPAARGPVPIPARGPAGGVGGSWGKAQASCPRCGQAGRCAQGTFPTARWRSGSATLLTAQSICEAAETVFPFKVELLSGEIAPALRVPDSAGPAPVAGGRRALGADGGRAAASGGREASRVSQAETWAGAAHGPLWARHALPAATAPFTPEAALLGAARPQRTKAALC